jgi:hypothetical protein
MADRNGALSKLDKKYIPKQHEGVTDEQHQKDIQANEAFHRVAKEELESARVMSPDDFRNRPKNPNPEDEEFLELKSKMEREEKKKNKR